MKKFKFISLATFIPFLLLNLSIWWSMRDSFEGIISVVSQILLIVIYALLYSFFCILLYQIYSVVKKDENLPVTINNMVFPYFALVILYLFFQILTVIEIAKPFLNGVLLNDYTQGDSFIRFLHQN